MAIHKYVFFINAKGIKTYRVREDCNYELVKFKGEIMYNNDDLDDFFNWFFRMASIAQNDMIDFCFLSEKPVESKVFSYLRGSTSSWDKKEIMEFCDKEIGSNYEIIIDENTSLISQNTNIEDGVNLTKLYLKCIPDFSFETEEAADLGSAETSILCRYFIDALSKL